MEKKVDVKVKSYLRKGKIVKSFTRKNKEGQKKKLILSSVGALGAIGLAGLGALALKKKLGSNVSRAISNPTAILPSRAAVLSPNTIKSLPTPTISQATVLSANQVKNVVEPTNLPKVLKRKKVPVISSKKAEPKVLSKSSYQINDEIENRIGNRIPKGYKYPSTNNPHNLSKAEMYSLSEYSSFTYYEVNEMLRGMPKSKEVQESIQDEINAIRSGLNKMPSTDSPKVYRGIRGSDDVKFAKIYDQYEVGKEFTEPSFLSTSREDLKGFGNKFRYEIIPKVKSQGKNIDEYSNISSEKEVLFPPNTSFKVIEKFIKDGTRYIRMEEL